MKLLINDEPIELVYSFRSSMYYEQISGHSLDFQKMETQDLINLYYSVVVASLQKARKPIISMLDFLDVIDDNGGEKSIMEFTNWYVDIMKKEFELLDSTTEDIVEQKPSKSKKKN